MNDQLKFIQKFQPRNSSLAVKYSYTHEIPRTRLPNLASPRFHLPKQSLSPRLKFIDISFEEMESDRNKILHDFKELDFMYKRYRFVSQHQRLINQSFSRDEQFEMIKQLKNYIPSPPKKKKFNLVEQRLQKRKIERDFPVTDLQQYYSYKS